ncbi:MAG: LptE family protein [Verrucomicrobiota bacterium]
MIFSRFLLGKFLLLTMLAVGCAGYRLGNIPRTDMEGVETIYVPVVKNLTFEPGLEVVTTNAIIREIENDGTYQTSRLRNADATLDVTITKFSREPLRRDIGDASFVTEYRGVLEAKVSLTNLKTGTLLFKDRTVKGTTDYFFQDNFQEVERQALPLASISLAQKISGMVTDGW